MKSFSGLIYFSIRVMWWVNRSARAVFFIEPCRLVKENMSLYITMIYN